VTVCSSRHVNLLGAGSHPPRKLVSDRVFPTDTLPSSLRSTKADGPDATLPPTNCIDVTTGRVKFAAEAQAFRKIWWVFGF
jgi:hypothetical protein